MMKILSVKESFGKVIRWRKEIHEQRTQNNHDVIQYPFTNFNGDRNSSSDAGYIFKRDQTPVDPFTNMV